jgi:hypothetical protein
MLLNPPQLLPDVPSPSCRIGDVIVDGAAGRTVGVDHGAITEVRDALPGDDRRYAGCHVAPGLIDSLDMQVLRSAVDRQLDHYRGLLVDRVGIIGGRLALRKLPELV